MTYYKGQNDNRPWGTWEVVNVGHNYIEKIIVVQPQGVLSLQSHEHRSEEWTILAGEAEITLEDKLLQLSIGGKVYIPQKAKHRVANIGKSYLVFHEKQLGENLDENDITRYDDKYGRT